MKSEISYPSFFDSLPKADIPVDGISGKLLQGLDHQVIFFDVKEKSLIPFHSHSPQWGVIIEGEMRLEMKGETLSLAKGDSYFIPEGVEHSVEVGEGFKAVDIFFEKNRYNVKNNTLSRFFLDEKSF